MMRGLLFVGMLLAMSGCAQRSATFYYYPGLDRPADRESHIFQLADKECSKFGMKVAHLQWRSWSDVGQETLTYACQ